MKHCCILILMVLTLHIPSRMMAQDKTTEQLALQYYTNGEFDKAAELYQELFAKTPNTYFYNYYISSLLESKNYRDAERLVKNLKETRELRRNFIVELGFVYQSQGDYKKADKEYERAIEKMEPTRMAVVDLSNAFLIRRLPEYAVKVYQKGRKVVSDGYPFYLELAGVYQSSRDYRGMMDEYLDYVGADETKLELVQNILQQLITNIGEEDFQQIVRGKIIERTQKFPDILVYSELLLWYSLQQKDFELALVQAKGMEKRTRDEGDAVFRVGQLAASNDYYEVAIDAFEYIKLKGEAHFLYLSAEILLLEVKYNRLMKTGSPEQPAIESMAVEYERVLTNLGKSAGTIVLMRNLAHLYAFYLEQSEKAIALLQNAISMQGVQNTVVAQCKTDLGDIYLMTGDVWEATLLYSQVEKAFKYDPVGFEAKFRNARLSFYIGEFDWSRTQLDVLRTATSKLIANDAMELSLLISDNLEADSNTVPLSMYAQAEMLNFRKKRIDALQMLDSISTMFPVHNLQDEVLLRKSEIYISMGDFQIADSLLSKLIELYPLDILADNALIMQARMHDYQLKDSPGAMTLYEKIITGYPGSIFVAEARKRYKELRGDNIN